jgi:protoporphyrinogen oxidase
MKIKYAILGAGPSGLSVAHALINYGISKRDIVVFEKEQTAGGLCRSEDVDGSPLDIGGGHFLDLKRKNVLDFLFKFMPDSEWVKYDRISKIRIRGFETDHPLEANLWQLPIDLQLDYLESIAAAGCVRGTEQPITFASWINWKFGSRIAEEYMLPYNRKIWSMNPDELGTYWLHKLPDVSFRETLMSCLSEKASGMLPAHGTFLYPNKYGYGEVWRRMGVSLGDSLKCNFKIESIDIDKKKLNDHWEYETLISTIPWPSWKNFCNLPDSIQLDIASLKNASIDIDYYPETLPNNAHWIYEPDEEISFHRILLRSNFIKHSRGYWTETNSKRSLVENPGIRYSNEYAYPINTVNKNIAIKKILDWAQKNSIIGLGRWGTWEHMNSDVVVDQAMSVANQLIKVSTR